MWYYYHVYSHGKNEGWSFTDYRSYDAVQAGVVSQQNYARGGMVWTNGDLNLVYGEAYRATDGNNGRGLATTNYNSVNRGWREFASLVLFLVSNFLTGG